jgi:hypothetical protein
MIRAECVVMSSREYDEWTRVVEAGRFASDRPGRHSVAGRTGRGANPPPQFGHTSRSTLVTQSAQNVHSNVQMRASGESGGRSLSHSSQLGRSSSATRAPYASCTTTPPNRCSPTMQRRPSTQHSPPSTRRHSLPSSASA